MAITLLLYTPLMQQTQHNSLLALEPQHAGREGTLTTSRPLGALSLCAPWAPGPRHSMSDFFSDVISLATAVWMLLVYYMHTVAQLGTQIWPLLIKSRGNDPLEGHLTAFSTALRKGNALLRAMRSDHGQSAKEFSCIVKLAESKFIGFSELEKWGYRSMKYDSYYDFDFSIPIKSALHGVGVSAKKLDEGGTYRAVKWEHEEETIHDERRYPPTYGSYTTIYNPQDGLIVGWGAFSPRYMGAKHNPPITTLPSLQHWSDVTFLQWVQCASASCIRNIRFVIQTPCENPVTQEIIKYIMDRTHQQLELWPGATFEIDTKEGQAILGSPSGQGVGYMLAEHKARLGNKIVEKVTVFQDEGKNTPRPPSILFYVNDYEGAKDTAKL